MTFENEAYAIADELRAIANLGLNRVTNEYDEARWRQMLAISTRLLAAVEARSPDEATEEYEHNLNHLGPYLAGGAVVLREGKILLMKRADNGLWCMPGGMTEIGETWAESAERELWEEVGVRGRAVRLLGVFDAQTWGSASKIHYYLGSFLIEAEPGSQPTTSNEATDFGFFGADGLPEMTRHHTGIVPLIFRMLRGETESPHFDETGERRT